MDNLKNIRMYLPVKVSYPECKRTSKNKITNSKNSKLKKKWADNLDKASSKEEIQMANTHEKCSISLAIGDMKPRPPKVGDSISTLSEWLSSTLHQQTLMRMEGGGGSTKKPFIYCILLVRCNV